MISSPSDCQHMGTTNALQCPAFRDTNGVQYSLPQLWMIMVLNTWRRFTLNISSQHSMRTTPSPLIGQVPNLQALTSHGTTQHECVELQSEDTSTMSAPALGTKIQEKPNTLHIFIVRSYTAPSSNTPPTMSIHLHHLMQRASNGTKESLVASYIMHKPLTTSYS